MEEIGRRFEGALVLTERESKGVRIRASAVQSALRCKFALVCRVATPRVFRRQSFIDLFTRLWGGDDGVTISDMEDDRFLARFVSEKDMKRVLDREPWDFDKSLVLLGALRDEGSVTDVTLVSSAFWVQIHGVPVRLRSPEVAEDIGGEVGQTMEIGRAGGGSDCVGRFLRVRVRMQINVALLRRTVVSFPGLDAFEVDFKYERLPEFCQECGLIGHPTRVCDERLGIRNKKPEERPYLLSLRADRDLHGKRLGFRVGRDRSGEGGSGSDASDSTGGAFTRSAGESSGVRWRAPEKQDSGQFLLEGPLIDTASSPCKSEEVKIKSKGVLIAENFAARQCVMRGENAGKRAARVLFPEENDLVSMDVVPVVETTTVELSKNLSLKVDGVDTSITDVKRLGQLLRSEFTGEGSLGGKAPRGQEDTMLFQSGPALRLDVVPVPFKMGSVSGRSGGEKSKSGRKVVKVSSRRTQQLGDVKPEVTMSGVSEGGKRKLEEKMDVVQMQTKKVMLSTSVPEVVGAVELPHHEQ